MSRQQDPKGVILTGYISNIEVVSPASGVNSAEEIESSSLRWAYSLLLTTAHTLL